MNYTVEELIRALEQCPPDYVVLYTDECIWYGISSVGIDHNEQTVELFPNG